MAPAQKEVMVLHGGQRHVNLRKTGRQAFCATNVQRKQTCVVSAPEAHGYLNILHNYLQRHIQNNEITQSSTYKQTFNNTIQLHLQQTITYKDRIVKTKETFVKLRE